jgi:DNA-binding CsgD family transcriptional regulator
MFNLSDWLRCLESQPNTKIAFENWVRGPLKRFFPFEQAFFAYAELVVGKIQIVEYLAIDHDPAYLGQLKHQFDSDDRGLLKEWMRTRKPILFDPEQPPAAATEFEVNELLKFKLINIASHGVLDLNARAGTYFAFSGVPMPFAFAHSEALELIAPYLNSIFVRIFSRAQAVTVAPLDRLSLKEREIALLLTQGLSDKEIAKRLGRSTHTIRNQVASILSKFELHSRAQLNNFL